MASAVLNANSSGTFFHHCQEVDHGPSECTLVALDPSLNVTRVGVNWRSSPSTLKPVRVNRPNPYDQLVEICHRFNRGQCPDTSICRLRHICSTPDCKKTSHGAVACPLHNESPMSTKAAGPPTSAKPAGTTPTSSKSVMQGPVCKLPARQGLHELLQHCNQLFMYISIIAPSACGGGILSSMSGRYNYLHAGANGVPTYS